MDPRVHDTTPRPPTLARGLSTALRSCLPAALLSLGACDAEAPGPTEEDYDMCKYDDFSVDITSGPNKGLHLAGTLYFVQKLPDTHIGGLLKTGDGLVVPISATVNDQSDLSLTFHTASGYVMGLGKMTGELCHADNIQGAAIGPVIAATSDINASDSGHWLLNAPSLLEEVPEETFDYPGDITNPDGDYGTTNVTVQQCTSGGGIVELRCGFLCLYTYNACRGGDHKNEVIL